MTAPWLPSPAEVAKYVAKAKATGLISDRQLAPTPRRDQYLRQEAKSQSASEAGRQAMAISQAARARKAAAQRLAKARKKWGEA
jgi:hypothetical protein